MTSPRFRVLVQPPLHRLQHVLVLPEGEAVLLVGGASLLDRTAWAGREMFPNWDGNDAELVAFRGASACKQLTKLIQARLADRLEECCRRAKVAEMCNQFQ